MGDKKALAVVGKRYDDGIIRAEDGGKKVPNAKGPSMKTRVPCARMSPPVWGTERVEGSAKTVPKSCGRRPVINSSQVIRTEENVIWKIMRCIQIQGRGAAAKWVPA